MGARAFWVMGWASLVLSALSGSALAETNDPQNAKARFEAALDNMLTLERPGQIGLATVWDGNKYVQCRRDRDDALSEALPSDLAKLARRRPRAPGAVKRQPAKSPAPTDPAQYALLCEAAGARMQPSLAHLLVRDRIEALGWGADPSFGNYVQAFPAGASISGTTDRILQTLGEGYGADLAHLEVETDWVVDVPCPPRNGPSQNLAGMINDAKSMASTAVHECAYLPDAAMTPDGQARTAQDLIDQYGPRVTGELQRLRINFTREVFFALTTDGGYVQCEPQDSPKAIYCEAVSADSWPVVASILTPERLARLHAAGFVDPGRAPNYSKTYPIDSADDATIARELLVILHDVYGYGGTSALKVMTEKE